MPKSKEQIGGEISKRGLVSMMNDTKWAELRKAVRSELPFAPPYQLKAVLNPVPQPEHFDSDVDYLGDWSDECLLPFYEIEWLRVRPRLLQRRGRLLACTGSFRSLTSRPLSQNMTLALPSKQDCFYVLEMLRTSLIDFRYTEPWADELIIALDSPPSWLCDLASRKYQGDQIRELQEFVDSEPFESCPAEMDKFAVACLWIRYDRRELSWATFLRMAGELLDSAHSDWDCETPYHYLTVYKDAHFTADAEERTKCDYLKDHDLKPWIAEAKQRFAPFLKRRRDNEAEEPTGDRRVVEK